MTMDDDGVIITNREIYDKVVEVERTLNKVLRNYVSWKALGMIATILVPAVALAVALWG